MPLVAWPLGNLVDLVSQVLTPPLDALPSVSKSYQPFLLTSNTSLSSMAAAPLPSGRLPLWSRSSLCCGSSSRHSCLLTVALPSALYPSDPSTQPSESSFWRLSCSDNPFCLRNPLCDEVAFLQCGLQGPHRPALPPSPTPAFSGLSCGAPARGPGSASVDLQGSPGLSTRPTTRVTPLGAQCDKSGPVPLTAHSTLY